MIINIGDAIKSTNGLRAGLRYQLRLDPPKGQKEPSDPEKVLILEGDPDRMIEMSKTLSTSQKAIPILISFAEDKEELERKLAERGMTIADLYQNIRKLLFMGYEDDEIVCSAIAHSDTEHFHIHMYVLNSFAGTDKTLKLHFGKGAQYLRAIEDFVNCGLGLEPPKRNLAVSYTRKEELLRRLGKSEKYTALKEELNALITELIATGQLRDAQDIRNFVEKELGGKVRRHGKNYMTIELGGHRIRLRGGIYDANFRGLEGEAQDLQRGAEEDTRAKLERAKEVLERYAIWRTQDIQKRYEKDRAELSQRDRQAQERATGRTAGRKMEIRPYRAGDRAGDRAYAWDHYNEKAVRPGLLGSNARRGRRNLHRPTLIDAYKKEAIAMGREAQQLKNTIDLRKLMSYLGIPFYWSETERGSYVLARVPWREDRHPSFIAHYKDGRWLWYDIARGEGGSVIDFAIRFFSAGKEKASFKEALEWLKSHREEIEHTPVQGMKLRQDGTAQRIEIDDDPELMDRLRQIWRLRTIPPWLKIGRRHIAQVKQRIGKDGEVEAFKVEKEATMPVMVFTDEHGKPRYWREVFPERTQKGWLTENEPILLRHGRTGKLYIVEGYTDALAVYQIDPKADICVLGTAQNAEKIEGIRGYEKVYIATDNDMAGERAYEQLKKTIPYADRLRYEGGDPMEAWLNGIMEIEMDRDRDYDYDYGFGLGL